MPSPSFRYYFKSSRLCYRLDEEGQPRSDKNISFSLVGQHTFQIITTVRGSLVHETKIIIR